MALDDDNIRRRIPQAARAARANLAPLHKWLSIKKRILKLDTVRTYDLWDRFTGEYSKEYSYDEGKKIVLEGLSRSARTTSKRSAPGLNPAGSMSRTQGKGSGAYHWGTYTSPSYVLMNYNNTMDAFSRWTRNGHAMHSYYTKQHEPYFYSGHYIFTAEVASTCNEAIMMKYLLERTKDKNGRSPCCTTTSSDHRTFYTQVMFSEFELAIHDRLEKHEASPPISCARRIATFTNATGVRNW